VRARLRVLLVVATAAVAAVAVGLGAPAGRSDPGGEVAKWWHPTTDPYEWKLVVDFMQKWASAGQDVTAWPEWMSIYNATATGTTNAVTHSAVTDAQINGGLMAGGATVNFVPPLLAASRIGGGQAWTAPFTGVRTYVQLYDSSLIGYAQSFGTGAGGGSSMSIPLSFGFSGTTATIGSGGLYNSVWFLAADWGSGVQTVYCNRVGPPGTYCPASEVAKYDGMASEGGTFVVNSNAASTSGPCAGAPIGWCSYFLRTPGSQERRTYRRLTTQAGYDATAYHADYGTVANPTMTEAQVSTMINQLDTIASADSSTPAADAQAALVAIGDYVTGNGGLPGTGGGGECTFPKRLPLAGVDETYNAYAQRLDQWASCWTGSTSYLPDVTRDATAGPASDYALAPIGTVIAVAVSVNGQASSGPAAYQWLYDSAGSYSPPDHLASMQTSTAPLWVKYKGELTTVPPPVSTCDKSKTVCLPTIASACGKFPFGLFCWFPDQLTALFSSGSSSPPELTFPGFGYSPDNGECRTLITATPGGSFDNGEGDYCEQSAAMHASTGGYTFRATDVPTPITDFIAVLRLVLGFLVWLVGLWFLGTRVLKIHGAHDGGEE
jgi:hypothetical protein